MNNRSPFIPNIPTPQGHWSDPQIFNSNNSSSNQNVPFTAHQQMQLQSQNQAMYNVGFTTSTAPSIPIQNTGNLFTEPWATNINMNSMNQVNYYQQVNQSYQQQLQQHQQAMQNIVNNQPRGMQLAFDTQQFVHFPVNLSPQSSSVPVSINSRSMPAMNQFSSRSSNSNNASRSSNSSVQYHTSPSSSPGIQLSLDSRSSGSMENIYVNPSSVMPLSLNSRNPSNNMSNNSSNAAPMYLPILNLNATSGSSGRSGTSALSYSSSPPSCIQRSPSSMSPFSGSSSSPSPTPQMSSINMRLPPASSFINNSISSSTTSVPFNQTSPGRMNRLPQSSPSSTLPTSSNMGIQQQFFNSRSQAQVQAAPPAAHLQYAPRSSPTPNIRPFAGSGNFMQQQSQQQPTHINQHQAHTNQAHSNQHITQAHHHQQPKAPSPPPPKPKKPRAPRKKKEPPMKPIPINPSSAPVVPSIQIQNTPTLPPHLANLMPNFANSWQAHHHMLNTVPVSTSSYPNSQYTTPSSQIHPYPPSQQNSGGMTTFNYSNPASLPPLTRPALVTSQHGTPTQSGRNISVIQTLNQSVLGRVQPNVCPPVPAPPITTASPPRRPSVSPVKNSPAKFSLLDQAIQRAGIPTVPSPMKTTEDVFGEAEIMKLVGTHDQEMKKSESGPGDFDLESELNRFYSPQSPNKDNQIKTSPTQVSTLTTSTTVTTPTRGGNTPSQPVTPKTAATTSKKSSDDDDIEVMFVKLSDKKNNKRKLPIRKGPPPKKVPTRVQSPAVQLQNRPNITISVTEANTPKSRRKQQLETKSNSMSRPAFPNGRYIQVAPKTTVPIPPSPLRTKATARKSTAPIPPLPSSVKGGGRYARQPVPVPSPKTTPGQSKTSTNRPRRAAAEIESYAIDSDPEPEPKMTRQAARALQLQQQKANASICKPKTVATIHEDAKPHLKMKLNLKTCTVRNLKNSPSPAQKRRSRPRSIPAASLKPPSPESILGLSQDEDDLLIVEEFFADSDDSYDPEGERDEASEESEIEEELSEEDEAANKKVHVSAPLIPTSVPKLDVEAEEEVFDPSIKKKKPPPKIEDDKEEEEVELAPKESIEESSPKTSQEKVEPVLVVPVSAVVPEDDGMHFTTPFDDDYESPSSSCSPPSPPFKNIIHGEEKLDPIPKPVLPEKVTTTNGKRKAKVMESDEDNEVEEVEQKFEMPKPAVITKGTKEEATTALLTMRSNLAQLLNFKIK